MKIDLSRRFGFLLNDVAKRYGERFDLLAREQIGLSRAQCRLLGVLAMNEGEPLTQVELAAQMGLSTMGVTSLCDRMEATGWIRRETSATDRRAKLIHLEPTAEEALHAALGIGDTLQATALSVLSPAERRQLTELLTKLQGSLKSMDVAQVQA